MFLSYELANSTARRNRMTTMTFVSHLEIYKSRAIAGRAARCRCKFRHVSNFATASCGSLSGSFLPYFYYLQTTPCPEKKRPEYFSHNFDKFRNFWHESSWYFNVLKHLKIYLNTATSSRGDDVMSDVIKNALYRQRRTCNKRFSKVKTWHCKSIAKRISEQELESSLIKSLSENLINSVRLW